MGVVDQMSPGDECLQAVGIDLGVPGVERRNGSISNIGYRTLS